MKGSTCLSLILAFGGAGAGQDSGETPVVIESDGWRLAGDLPLPEDAGKPVPAVVLLHGAARNRVAYTELARALASRGIASLRLEAVQRNSRAEIWIVPGSGHGSDLARDSADLSERIALWLAARLGS